MKHDRKSQRAQICFSLLWWESAFTASFQYFSNHARSSNYSNLVRLSTQTKLLVSCKDLHGRCAAWTNLSQLSLSLWSSLMKSMSICILQNSRWQVAASFDWMLVLQAHMHFTMHRRPASTIRSKSVPHHASGFEDIECAKHRSQAYFF